MNNHKNQRATSKITKEPKQKSGLGTASKKNYWGASTSLYVQILNVGTTLCFNAIFSCLQLEEGRHRYYFSGLLSVGVVIFASIFMFNSIL